MKWKTGVLLVMLSGALFAQGNDEELASRLKEAEKRMQEAAREMAELRMELHGDELKNVFSFVHTNKSKRAVLGINVGTVKIDHGDGVEVQGEATDGVEILGVTPGGPADKAGLQGGDVILSLDGHPLAGQGKSPDKQLLVVLDDVEPGSRVQVRYRRDNREHSTEVETGSWSTVPFARKMMQGFDTEVFVRDNLEPLVENLPFLPGLGMRNWGGLELVPLNPELGKYFGADEGILVVRAEDDNHMGLQSGDVIRTIGGATPKSPPDAMRLLRFYQPGDKLVIDILRNKRSRTLEVVVPERET